MKQSNLVHIFITSAWHLHAPIHSALDGLLRKHVNGTKGDIELPRNELFTIKPDPNNESDDKEKKPLSDHDIIDRMVDNNIYYDQRMMLENEAKDDYIENGVAVVYMRGVLARQSNQVNGACLPEGRSYAQLINQMFAARDAGAHTIVLRAETPGGMANGCEELNQAIRSISASGIPVHGFVDGYCFSAGTYALSACDSITLSSTGAHYGSIGTIMSTFDDSAAWAKEGYEAVVIRSGPYKALGQPGEKISDTAKAEMQRTCDAYAHAFYDAVIAGRGLSEEQAASVLNGRTFTAAESIELGLADQIADWSTFLNAVNNQFSITPTHSINEEKNMQFGKTKTPAAKAADDQGDVKGLSKSEFATLAKAYPTHIAQIEALDTEGKSFADIENAILKDKIAALQEDPPAAKTDAAAAAKAAETQAAEKAASDKLAAENAELKAKVDKAQKWDSRINAVKDPGSDDENLAEGSVEAIRAEWEADADLRDNFALGGFNSYVQFKCDNGLLSKADADDYFAALKK